MGGPPNFDIIGGGGIVESADLTGLVAAEAAARIAADALLLPQSQLGVALGAAKTGTDNTVGGPSGSALSPTVVSGSQPRAGGPYVAGATGIRDFISSADYRLLADADDTNSVQLAGNAAIAANKTLLLPSSLILSSTIVWGTQAGGPFGLDIIGGGAAHGSITWNGPNNSTIFKTWGLVRSSWQNLYVTISDTQHDLVVYDHDVGTAQNSSLNSIQSCHITCGNPLNITGWRLGYSAATGQDISGWSWRTCTMTVGSATAQTNGCIAWSLNGSNTLTQSWVGCGSQSCYKMVTCTAVAGAGGNAQGNWTWAAVDTHANWIDFDGPMNPSLTIKGGRIENTGHRVINSNLGATSRFVMHISLEGVSMFASVTDDGLLFSLLGAHTFTMRDCAVTSFTTAITTMIEASCGSTSSGSIVVDNCFLLVAAPMFWNIIGGSGPWSVTATNNHQVSPAAGNPVAGLLRNSRPNTTIVINAGSVGANQTVDCTGVPDLFYTITPTANITVTFTNMAPGQAITVEQTQPAAGGPFGVTFAPAPKTPGGAGVTWSTNANAVDEVTLWSPDGAALRAAPPLKAFA